MISALFIAPEGPYPTFDDVDCWPVERDARLYTGDNPVVAHPPCQLWVNFAALNFKRWGGEHNRPGNDGGCFEFALATVRRCGGVLEHPAGSRAWPTFGLTPPKAAGWQRVSDAEWVCEIWQSAYGHKARKRTWLLYVGQPPADLNWARLPGTHQVGWFDRNKPTLGKKEASRTPPLLARALVALASASR